MERNHIAIMTLVAVLLASAAQAEPSIYPTGVTRYDPQKAENVFVLFSAADDKTYLIDMDGEPVRQWDHAGFPGGMIDPALIGGERGRVLVQLEHMNTDAPGVNPALPVVFRDKSIGELDWNGKIVWQWGARRRGAPASRLEPAR